MHLKSLRGKLHVRTTFIHISKKKNKRSLLVNYVTKRKINNYIEYNTMEKIKVKFDALLRNIKFIIFINNTKGVIRCLIST